MKAIYKRPELVKDTDGKTIGLTKATWNHDTMSVYILENGITHWVKIGDLARLVWGRNTDTFRKAARRRLPVLKRHMALTWSKLLVVEYNDPRGAASAVKIYDPELASDIQAMHRMLADMTARKDSMLTYYEKCTGLSGVAGVAS